MLEKCEVKKEQRRAVMNFPFPIPLLGQGWQSSQELRGEVEPGKEWGNLF